MPMPAQDDAPSPPIVEGGPVNMHVSPDADGNVRLAFNRQIASVSLTLDACEGLILALRRVKNDLSRAGVSRGEGRRDLRGSGKRSLQRRW